MNELIKRIDRLCRPLAPRPTGVEPHLPMLTDVRAVVFDIYGTLLISASGDIGLAGERGEKQAFSAAYEAAFASPPPSNMAQRVAERLKSLILEHHAARQGQGIDYPEVDILNVWKQLLASFERNADRNRIETLAVEYECRVNPVWPMPGMVELLEALNARDLSLGIVSNAQFYTPLTIQALAGSGLRELGFTDDFCTWSYRELEAKPSTAIYQKTLDALKQRDDIEPNQILYVGNDQRNDIWPAAMLGCRTALFAGDQRSLRWRKDDPRCNQVKPDAIVTELAQIPGLLW